MLEFSIGRDNCAITLDSEFVSARHASLIFGRDGRLRLRDEASRNGSFMLSPDGQETRIGTQPVDVDLATVLRLGDERLRVSDLIVQLLDRRPPARKALAQSWTGAAADSLLAAHGGRDLLLGPEKVVPQHPSPPERPKGPVRIDPETGDLIHG